ncbi:hypothetical protein ADEAN_000897100 [Angomonas deanei]|uniref:Uncharacterized protein n=1 Tax=Angomonas deanei TaxID=59799 RepID=A0A7G2CQ13_9TRYP|nr:hypothetical protein ADEAN_000897100 [Angomonas deanei]
MTFQFNLNIPKGPPDSELNSTTVAPYYLLDDILFSTTFTEENGPTVVQASAAPNPPSTSNRNSTSLRRNSSHQRSGILIAKSSSSTLSRHSSRTPSVLQGGGAENSNNHSFYSFAQPAEGNDKKVMLIPRPPASTRKDSLIRRRNTESSNSYERPTDSLGTSSIQLFRLTSSYYGESYPGATPTLPPPAAPKEQEEKYVPYLRKWVLKYRGRKHIHRLQLYQLCKREKEVRLELLAGEELFHYFDCFLQFYIGQETLSRLELYRLQLLSTVVKEKVGYWLRQQVDYFTLLFGCHMSELQEYLPNPLYPDEEVYDTRGDATLRVESLMYSKLVFLEHYERAAVEREEGAAFWRLSYADRLS